MEIFNLLLLCSGRSLTLGSFLGDQRFIFVSYVFFEMTTDHFRDHSTNYTAAKNEMRSRTLNLVSWNESRVVPRLVESLLWTGSRSDIG